MIFHVVIFAISSVTVAAALPSPPAGDQDAGTSRIIFPRDPTRAIKWSSPVNKNTTLKSMISTKTGSPSYTKVLTSTISFPVCHVRET